MVHDTHLPIRCNKIHKTDYESNRNNKSRNTEYVSPENDSTGDSSSRVQELQDKIVALQSQVDSRNEELLRMQKRIDGAGAIIADSLRVMKGKQEEIDTLQHDNNKLQSQLQQARELICQHYEILQSTTSSIEAKEKEIHNKTEQVAYHRKKASDMQKRHAETVGENKIGSSKILPI
ncbi:hypothetical protein ACA910_013237 [Epithemia clementina (nom. ined.)]